MSNGIILETLRGKDITLRTADPTDPNPFAGDINIDAGAYSTTTSSGGVVLQAEQFLKLKSSGPNPSSGPGEVSIFSQGQASVKALKRVRVDSNEDLLVSSGSAGNPNKPKITLSESDGVAISSDRGDGILLETVGGKDTPFVTIQGVLQGQATLQLETVPRSLQLMGRLFKDEGLSVILPFIMGVFV